MNETKTLRDEIAIAAMQAHLMCPDTIWPHGDAHIAETHAREAYEMADAMLAERARTAPQPEKQPEKPASRYPWDAAPEWAMWAATDQSGDWFFFEKCPRVPELFVEWNDMVDGKILYGGNVGDCPEFRHTLEARPTP